MSTQSEVTIWIGMAHVQPTKDPGRLDGCPGAYVSAVALAGDESEYIRLVGDVLEDMGFLPLEVEDVEPLEVRLESGTPEPELLALADALSAENRVGIGTFHAYREA